MYGAYSAITFIVLLNMLIAMMNCSYESIATQADTEWKFHRSKLWISYFEEGGTLPVPFNVIPSPKSCLYLFVWLRDKVCCCSKRHQHSKWQSIRKVVKKVNEKEARYQAVMRDLIRRYLMMRQRNNEKQGVTEDDLNEIKGDISAFRFELLEILRTNGMKTPAYTEQRASKLRRRGSKRSIQSRRFGPRFKSISEEDGKSNDGSFDASSSTVAATGRMVSEGSTESFQSATCSEPGFVSRQFQSELPLDPSQLPAINHKQHQSNHKTENRPPFVKKVSFNQNEDGPENVKEDHSENAEEQVYQELTDSKNKRRSDLV